jgi:hypothetical protein
VGVDSTPEEATMAPPREPDTATASEKCPQRAKGQPGARLPLPHKYHEALPTTANHPPPPECWVRQREARGPRETPGRHHRERKTLPEAENIRGGELAAHIISVG